MNDTTELENKHQSSKSELSDLLSVGEWRLMAYGFEVHEWYVLRITDDMVQIGKKSWLVSSAMWMDKKQFMERSKPLGKGEFRWWWHFLPWKDCVMPFSSYR